MHGAADDLPGGRSGSWMSVTIALLSMLVACRHAPLLPPTPADSVVDRTLSRQADRAIEIVIGDELRGAQAPGQLSGQPPLRLPS